MKKKIFIVTGEPSGDLHGASLVKELYKIIPPAMLDIKATGGSHLRSVNVDIFFDSKDLSSVGILDVINKLSLYVNLEKELLKEISLFQPHVVVLIDFPGFNMRLLKKIKTYSPKTKIIYYMPPQVWVWKEHRTKDLAKYCDLVLCGLPFEEEFHKKRGVNAIYIGSPIVKELPDFNREEVRSELGIKNNETLIGILPGSRKAEVGHMLSVYLNAAEILHKENPNYTFIVSQSDNVGDISQRPEWSQLNELKNKVKILPSQNHGNYKLMCASDVMMVSSGTATLETALYETPLVLGYRGDLINYILYKLIINAPMVGLPNIIANKFIIPELLQFNATPNKFAAHIKDWTSNPEKMNSIKNELKEVRKILSEKNASEEAAKLLSKLI